MSGYVPSLYFEHAWPYRRPRGPYIAPSGVITVPGPGHITPCHADREIFLCLIQKSRISNRAEFTTREVAKWIGAHRRLGVTRTHIERVSACMFMVPRGSDFTRYQLGRLRWLDAQRFDLTYDPAILEGIRNATPFSLDQAARLRSRPAVLDLYLCLTQRAQLYREFADFTHEIDPRRVLPSAADHSKARQDVLRRLEIIQGMVDAHICPAAMGTRLLLDFEAPKRVVRIGVSREKWQERQRRAREIRQMAPEERQVIGRVLRMLEDYERRLDEPDPWADVRESIRRAEAQTAYMLEQLSKLEKP